MAFRENVSLDAALVYASVHGGSEQFMLTAFRLGLSPSEASRRAAWLKKRSPQYIKQVSDAVVRLERANETRT